MRQYSALIVLFLSIVFMGCGPDPSSNTKSTEPISQSDTEVDSAIMREVPETHALTGILTWKEGIPYLLNCEDGSSLLVLDTVGILSRSLPVKGTEIGETVYASIRGRVPESISGNDPFLDGEVELTGLEDASADINAQNCQICADFRGVGDEPGWSVSIFAPDSIVLQTEYGMITQRFPYNFPAYNDGEWNFEILSESSFDVLYIRFVDNECIESMLGSSSPFQVTVDVGNKHYEGCGTKLN